VARVPPPLAQVLEPRSGDRGSGRGLPARLGLGAAAAAVIAIPFTLLMLLVLSKWKPLDRLDKGVASDLHRAVLGHTRTINLLELGANVFDPWTFRVLVTAVAVWLWWRGARRLALWAVVTMVIGGVLSVALKVIVNRSRPVFPDPVTTASGYSFPSGHALNSMLCVGILVLVFLPVLGHVGRIIVYSVGAAVVVVTGYDRVALGVHYLSDVIAGWVVALACLAGTGIAFEVWRREHGKRPADAEEGIDPEAAASMRH
jgi:undecaprenyl-diphosphatase